MTISYEQNKNRYVATLGTTTYPYTFKIFADTDLTVIVQDADGVQTTKTLNTDYTVTGAGDDAGGNVVFGSAPTAGFIIVILGTYDYKQETDYEEGDSFPSAVHENALDKITMINIKQKEEIDRCLKGPTTNPSDVDYELPYYEDCKSNVLGFDATGKNFIAVAGTTGVTTTNFMATVLDDSTAAQARATLGAAEGNDTLTALATVSGINVMPMLTSTSTASGVSAGATGIQVLGDATAADVRTTIDAAGKNSDNVFTETQLYDDGSLTSASVIEWNMGTYQNTSLTLEHNATLSGTNIPSDTGYYTCLITNGNAYTLAYTTDFKFSGGSAPSNTTTSGAVDLLACYVKDGSIYATLSTNLS
jgi:hypothetical protein